MSHASTRGAVVASSLLTLALASFSGCYADAANPGEGEGEGEDGGGGGGDVAGEGEGEGESSTDGGGGAGVLTAGAWDDNANYDYFRAFLDGHADLPGAPPITSEARDAAHERFAQRGPKTDLDVAIVLDTTGSMGDELSYLQTELAAIAGDVQTYADANHVGSVRWAVLTYKDDGDEYVTRATGFSTTVSDAQSALAQESSGGGGDYPEADDQALNDALQLDWRSGDGVARVVFWVGDAPHHVERAQQMADAITAAAGADVHIYPISASGADTLLEYSMRSAAQLTGGRYLFLTDDSGIGDSHLEPSIPCYFVTHLDTAMVRMVMIELSGLDVAPNADDIVRAGGDPQNGACTLDDGTTVSVL